LTASTERYNALLEAACEANLNMLRVWGGGIYETEHFYERCDELGLMVWQDFMFACATYPEDEPYPELVVREARHQVARLASHPSVVLWCGGNEDVLAWQSWGFREQLAPGQSWGRKYWLELLPRVCAELDPTRPYWPDSPWSGSLDVHANDPERGDRHTWDLRVEEYRTMVPRFTSEFGHQSPPNLCTLQEALDSGALVIGGHALAARQRAGGGDEAQYARPLADHFAPASSFEEWLYQAQVLQARAMGLAITWARANRGRSMGALFWQWNDVWSGPSWSALDVKLRAKPFWHALQRAAEPRMVSIEPLGKGGVTRAGRAGDLVVAVVNDTADEWRPVVTVVRMDLEGNPLASAKERVAVGPRSVDTSLYIERLVGAPADPRAECAMVEAEGQRGWWMFERDKDLLCKPARVEIGIDGAESSWRVRVRARTLVRDLWIEPRDPWIRCAPNLLTLLPGEEAVIEVQLESPPLREPAMRVHAAGGVVRIEQLDSTTP
jgi:beta-mannosidase